MVGGSAQDVVDKPFQAAMDAGVANNTAFCIGFVSGVTTGWSTCAIIDYMIIKGLNMGNNLTDLIEWVDDGVQRRYPWYITYEVECGKRPDYEALAKQQQQEASSAGSSQQGAAQEGTTQEGASQDGSSQEASTQESASQGGATQEQSSQEGASQGGTTQEGTASGQT